MLLTSSFFIALLSFLQIMSFWEEHWILSDDFADRTAADTATRVRDLLSAMVLLAVDRSSRSLLMVRERLAFCDLSEDISSSFLLILFTNLVCELDRGKQLEQVRLDS